jgi:hypothetical protein
MTSHISDILRPYIVADTMAYEKEERVAEAEETILALFDEAIGEASTNVYGPEDSLPLNKWARFISDQDYKDFSKVKIVER